jgi:hypothetical protein
MKRKCFRRTNVAAEIAPWLYVIWFITGMWTSFYDLSDLDQKITANDGPNCLYCEISPEFSRKDQPQQDDLQQHKQLPLLTQFNSRVSTTATLIE